MLDINYIRKNTKEVKKALGKKNIDSKQIDSLLEVDVKVKKFQQRIEVLRHDKKNDSKQRPSENEIRNLKHKKGTLKTLEMGLKQYSEEREKILFSLPNLPADDVKKGKDESENKVISVHGKKTKFDFEAKEYLLLAEKLDLIDMKAGAKVSGARFNYLKGQLAELQYALMLYSYNFLLEKEFVPIIPPLMIKEEIMKGLGYTEGLDEKDKYHLAEDKLYLVGTAEQSLIPLHAGETLKHKDLPKRYMAYTPAFRREAGSYGKDTKGILRVHQFDKMEMVSFSHPDESDKEQEFILATAEKMVEELNIPYRIVKMCSGDLSFPSARTFDIECWMPGQNVYRETHSHSNCTDFQSRRLGIKFKNKDNKNEYIHTLNGTAFAMGRTLIAIIENYQTKEGTIIVPEVLQKYCRFKEIK